MNTFFLSLLQPVPMKEKRKDIKFNRRMNNIDIHTKRGFYSIFGTQDAIHIVFHHKQFNLGSQTSFWFNCIMTPEKVSLLRSMFPFSGYKISLILRFLYLFNECIHDWVDLGGIKIDMICRHQGSKKGGCSHYVLTSQNKKTMMNRNKIIRTLKSKKIVGPPHFSS
jgi:hypothetical protein